MNKQAEINTLPCPLLPFIRPSENWIGQHHPQTNIQGKFQKDIISQLKGTKQQALGTEKYSKLELKACATNAWPKCL